ncbi:hypothetical protein PFBG_02319 [Plasmodium falciparum 7G8]|uniref:Rifin n=1 Tax=Plasmodium falciparum (isolate 7G8) TaxID=57266 RepID=W7FNP7_PLAF8|nr:hypothetical protein PFBG_02319 [Plasmodium falciparum 7G8]
MNVHYFNILLFALPLNILEYNQRNHNITTYHTSNTKPTRTHRTLCECELYAPSNYENVPEMKEIMENFNHKTSERFKEYYERMKTTRQKCREQCDKDIQKIILKDKMEKQMAQQLTTLETKITTEDIPTCICEKSLADKVEKTCLKSDKVEKTCLKCTQNLGGIVAPSSGVLAGIAEGALYAWKPKALEAAIAAAQKSGEAAANAAGLKAGLTTMISEMETFFNIKTLAGKPLISFFTPQNYNKEALIIHYINQEYKEMCLAYAEVSEKFLCIIGDKPARIKYGASTVVKKATKAVADTTANETPRFTAAFTTKNTTAVEAAASSYTTAIIASIVAIVVIVLVMVLIYLILSYRRKKKMKKKLQYIKLLKE